MDVAIRDAILPAAGTFRAVEQLAEIGARGVEIEVRLDSELETPHLVGRGDEVPYSLADEEGIGLLRTRLTRERVRAGALLVANDFSAGNAGAHVERVVQVVRAAATLGVPAVRIDPLSADKTLSADVVRARFVDGVRQVLRRTAHLPVDLGIENHGPIANDPAWLDAVLDELDDPRAGLTLDTGNFYWFGFARDEVYGLVEKYASRAKHTHVKNINFPPDRADRRREVGYGYKEYCCGVDEGNLDLRRVVRLLRDGGYDGDLCVEDESLFKVPPDRRVEALRRQVRALRDAVTSEARG